VSENVFKARKAESGETIEKVADSSMQESMEEGKKLTIEYVYIYACSHTSNISAICFSSEAKHVLCLKY
jgi:hypothetical protein